MSQIRIPNPGTVDLFEPYRLCGEQGNYASAIFADGGDLIVDIAA
jgi:hypothetical protein